MTDPKLRVIPLTPKAISDELREIGITRTAMWLAGERKKHGFPKPPDDTYKSWELAHPEQSEFMSHLMRDREYAQIVYDQFLDPENKESKE